MCIISARAFFDISNRAGVAQAFFGILIDIFMNREKCGSTRNLSVLFTADSFAYFRAFSG